MNKLKGKLRFEILVPFVVAMESKRQRESGSLIKESSHEMYEKVEAEIIAAVTEAIMNNTTHDHKDCPLPLTCTGYESALEDVRYALELR